MRILLRDTCLLHPLHGLSLGRHNLCRLHPRLRSPMLFNAILHRQMIIRKLKIRHIVRARGTTIAALTISLLSMAPMNTLVTGKFKMVGLPLDRTMTQQYVYISISMHFSLNYQFPKYEHSYDQQHYMEDQPDQSSGSNSVTGQAPISAVGQSAQATLSDSERPRGRKRTRTQVSIFYQIMRNRLNVNSRPLLLRPLPWSSIAILPHGRLRLPQG